MPFGKVCDIFDIKKVYKIRKIGSIYGIFIQDLHLYS